MELDRVKRNVSKMVGMNAPESDIDAYIASEGATVDQVKTYRLAPQDTQDPRITELQKPGAAQRFLRGVPGLGGALDEIGAASDAAISWATGGRTGEPYDQALTRRRDAIAKSDAENPIRNTVEGVVGGVVSAASLPFLRPAGAGTGMTTQAANTAFNATLAAVPTGFTEGEGGFQNRVENAFNYGKTAAATGLVMGGALSRFQNAATGTPANSVARDAQNIGMTVPTFMEGGRASQNIASKLGAIPFVGDDINSAVANARNQSQQAVENISRTVSPNILAREAGDNASAAMQERVGAGARAVSDRVYEPVNRAMANVVAPLNNTRQAAQELLRQQNEATAPLHARAIGEIDAALNQPNGLSFEGMTRLRTRIGNMMDNAIDPENRTAAAGLNAIYGGLSRDMEAAIAQNGGPRAQQAWERANAITRQIAERRDVVARLVGAQGDKAGEGIVDKIVTMASTKSTADAARLGQARRIMGAEAWRGIAGNAIARMGRNQSNLFSPDIFLKNYTQLSHEGRRLLFQSTGDDNLLPALESLANVSQRLQAFNRLGNPSGTGGVTALLAALGGAATGDMFTVGATTLGGRGIGILMSRPAVVRAVTAHAQNMARFARDRRTQAAMAATAANLARLIEQETGENRKEVELRIMGASQPQTEPRRQAN